MKKNVQDELVRRYVQYIDKTAQTILFYSKTSSVYKYEEDRWLETGIEGTCVIYTKAGTKQKELCVLNRKKKEDFFLGLNSRTKISREGCIVVFIDNKRNTTYGVWFCDPQTIDRAVTVLNC